MNFVEPHERCNYKKRAGKHQCNVSIDQLEGSGSWGIELYCSLCQKRYYKQNDRINKIIKAMKAAYEEGGYRKAQDDIQRVIGIE